MFGIDLTKLIKFLYDNLDAILIISFLVLFIFIEIYLRKKIKKIKSDINKKYSSEQLTEIDSLENLDQDLYIEYYKGKNILNLIRFVIIFSGFTFIILFKAPGIFNFLAIALGAIIIIFKDIILSFLGFFYISTHYKIGENIVLGDAYNPIRGEIVYINILNVGIIGKSPNGEHNGQLHSFPNYKLITENVINEELSVSKYRKEEFEIYYKNDLFSIGFDEFLKKLKEFLDSELTRKNITNIGNYKTYIGYKYKLRFVYDKDYLIIKVFVIEKHRTIISLQNKIVSFVEKLKKDYIPSTKEEEK